MVEFFEITPLAGYSQRYAEFSPLESGNLPTDTCPACGGTTSLLHWAAPHRVDVRFYGKEWPDVVPNCHYEFLSERAVRALESEGLKCEFALHPVQIRRITPAKRRIPPAPQYYYMEMHPGTVRADEVKSGIVRDVPVNCSVCGDASLRVMRRLVIDESTWHGEDLFCPQNLSGFRICTRAFVEVFKKHDLGPFAFVPAHEVFIDWYGEKDLPPKS